MRESVRTSFADHVAKYEGRCTWLYLDTKALVTTGVGNLVDPISLALPLPWLRVDGTAATEQEIRSDWWAIKGTPSLAVRGANAARAVARLHLDECEVDRLVARKRDEFWSHLVAYFPEATAWPADAQFGLLLHAWAVGPHAHRRGWPKMTRAMEAGDWLTVAEECVMPKARPARNEAHQRCFQNAAAVALADGDRDTLHYPEALF